VDVSQYQWRYRHERALRNLYIESGNLFQRVLVVATALRLSGLPTPAFSDETVAALLNLNSVRQFPVYSLTFGMDPRG
jgi:nitroreductase